MKNKNKIGITLIESIVAIAIFAICLQGFTVFFLRSYKNNAYSIEMGRSSFKVSQGVGKMVEYLRKARQADNGDYPLASAENNELFFYSDYDSDNITERLHFYYDNGTVFMGVTNPTNTLPKTYPAGDEQIITIADKIVNDSVTEPIFYYYNKNYPGDVANNPVNTSANLAEVRLIKIHLKINIDPRRAPDNIEMESFVEVRNLNDYDRLH